MTTTTTIAGTAIPSVKEQSLQIDDSNNERSVLSTVVQDSTGLTHYQKGQQINVVDSALGTLFAGNVNDSTETNLVPNTQINSQVNAHDLTYLADKRTYVDDDSRNANQFAGTIVTDLIQRYLSFEGVVAQYAMRRDRLFADFAQGVLSNTVAANNGVAVGTGDLELAPAGTAVSVTEKTTSAFGAGTLNNASATNNTLQPTLASAIKLQAYLPQTFTGSTYAYLYFKIWSGSMTIAANDIFHYELWMPSTIPDAVLSGVDFVCTDGTILGFQSDQLNFAGQLPNTLTGEAINSWYNRDIAIGALSGKSIAEVRIALYGQKVGTYALYVKNVYLNSQSGSPFFSKTATATQVSPPQQLQSAYFNASSISIVQVADKITAPPLQGATPAVYRISPSQSIDAPKLLKSSFISWIATTPGKSSVNVAVSYDGGSSYIPCTNNAALPGMPPGSNIAGLSVQFRQEFYTTDPDPTLIPIISYISWNIQPSYNTTKSDVTSSYVTGGSWAAGGTLTNLANTSGNLLTLNSVLRNWNLAESSGQTIFGLGGGSQAFQLLRFSLSSNATSEMRSRFDFAGTWADFTMEFDVFIDTHGVLLGCVYRTTGWQNNNNTFAYAVELQDTTIELIRGTNSSSGAGTRTSVQLVTFGTTLSLNQWYRVKVVASGSSHKVYVNDVLYINATDATYTVAGNVGLRNNNTTASFINESFDNFGITAALSGTWVSNAISLTGAGNYLNSIITWADGSSDLSQETILVEASINGGSTYMTCTNGQPIPNFTPGQSLSGVNLTLRVTLTGTTATSLPGINQLTVRVLGAFSATGTRISPLLDLTPAGVAGSTLINWIANVSTNTTLLVESSPDQSTWTAQANGSSIFGINAQPDPTKDGFDTNTSANYISANYTGGSTATATYDTANSRLILAGGVNAVYVYTPLTNTNGRLDVYVDMDQSDSGGPIWNYTDATHFYALEVHDASGSVGTPNQVLLKKFNGGSSSTLATASISFTRGTPHRIHVNMVGLIITVFFDGVQVLTFTEGTALPAGNMGLFNNGGTSRVYQLWMQPLGDPLQGKLIYTRVTLTSTDPTLTPQMQDLVVVCHDPNISNGVVIPKTAWQYSKQISQCLDNLAKQSNFWWAIVPSSTDAYKKIIKFLAFGSVPSPWILTGNDVQVSPAPSIQNIADLYGNKFYVPNATNVTAQSKQFVGNGSATTFTLDYPVDSMTGITLQTSGVGASINKTFGVKNIDTGKDWYYQVGSNVITQDANANPLNQLQTLTVAYNGQVPYTAIAQDPVEQTNYMLLESGAKFIMRPFGQSTLIFNPNSPIQENSSGIVERFVDGTGLNKAAADALAANLLARYKVRGRTFKFSTLRAGLATGQLLSIFFSQFGISDKAFLINRVVLKLRTKGDGTTQVVYAVEASETPWLGSFIKLFQA